MRLVVPYEPGGSADIVGRAAGRWLNERLGRPVIVENKGGAGASLGTEAVVRSPADGNTLLVHTGTIAVEAAAQKKLPYNAQRDLVPVAMVAEGAFALLVNPRVPVNSVAELIEYCKAAPGKYNYASSGIGTSVHLSMELFKSMAGINVMHIPYKGGAPSLNAVASGETEMMMNPLATAKPLGLDGRVRALAVSTKSRTSLWPELPSLDAAGVPGYDTSVWYGLSAPAGTPQDIVEELAATLGASASEPANKTWLNAQGLEPVGDKPAEFKGKIEREIQVWATLIKESGLKLE
ncbi:tripartite tricarboxylate transporter substrate binding protein [Verticiella sediminum]